MAVVSSLVQNAKFPYRIFLDLSERLKVAEATITKMLAEREALECDKDDEVKNLKQRISELTHENNRYHLAISYCTVCAPDDADPEVPSLEVSIKASTLLPSLDPGPASLSSTIPDLMSITWDRKQADTEVKKGQVLYQQDGEDPCQAGGQVPGP